MEMERQRMLREMEECVCGQRMECFAIIRM